MRPDSIDYCVIGSGPAGVSAAKALVSANRGRVHLLDAGSRLDDQRKALVSRMGGQEPDRWTTQDLAMLKGNQVVTAKGIPLKRVYGSLYPFEPIEQLWSVEKSGVDIHPSFALGGLSAVWGAGILPSHKDDIADWPFQAAELTPHYREVLKFMPIAAGRDDLEREFPLYSDTVLDLPPSRQGSSFLLDAQLNRDSLARRGVTVGRARLAVDARSCRRCGLCLHGCPYGLIYNSETTLELMRGRGEISYETDFVVDELRETSDGVEVIGRDRTTGAPRTVRAKRIFLGAGVIPTAAILLRSLGRFDSPLMVRDSPYFLLPLLRLRGVPQPDSEALHSLVQAYILIKNHSISESFVHLSVYGYNDLMELALRRAGGVLGRAGGPFWRALAARMLVCGGYLHSRHSPGFTIRIAQPSAGPTHLTIEGTGQPDEIRARASRVGRALGRVARYLKAVPLVPMIQHSLPGRGFHAGASFPMSRDAGPQTSDVLGRPQGFRRVHIVDASALPSIPATTITFTVMAMAHRTATLAVNADD